MIKEQVDARKERIDADTAWALLDGKELVRVAKGKKHIDFDLTSDDVARDDVLTAVMGPSGNLRAPTIMLGKTVLVGFHADVFEEVFSG